MTTHGWDAIPADVPMPVAGGTDTSGAFSVPRWSYVMAIHTPAFASSATLKVQSLAHDSDTATEVWTDVQFLNLTNASLVALAGITQSKTTTIPVAITGGGVLRFVASADQSGAPTTIKIDFS